MNDEKQYLEMAEQLRLANSALNHLEMRNAGWPAGSARVAISLVLLNCKNKTCFL